MSIEFWTQVRNCKENMKLQWVCRPWILDLCYDILIVLTPRIYFSNVIKERYMYIRYMPSPLRIKIILLLLLFFFLTSPVVLPVWNNENDKYLLLESPHKSTNSNSKGTVVVLNYILRENFQGRCALFFSIHIHSMT